MSDSKAVSRYDGPRTIDDLVRYSQVMADGASVLPAQYRRQPGAILFAVEYAKALDVSPVTAITGIHVIEGKPTASAGLISALIRRAGHQLRVSIEGTVENGDLTATATIVRTDDPDHTYRSVWTMQRAKRAGLLSITGQPGAFEIRARSDKGKVLPWESYTESMLKARAVTEVGRDAAEDVLLGVHYTPEELGAEVNENGEPVYTVTTVQDRGPSQQQPPAEPTRADPPAADEVTADELERHLDLMFEAESVEELNALWTSPIPNGKRDRAASLKVGDADGVELSLFDVYALAGPARAAGGDAWAQVCARFGRVPVIEHDRGDTPDDGEAGTPASEPPAGPQQPSSDTAAPEADAAPSDAQGLGFRAEGVEGPNRRTLNLVADQLNAEQRAAIVEWRTAWQHSDPTEENAARTCSAIATGQITKLVEVADGPDPREVLAEAQLRVSREIEEEAAERHAEAASATAAGGGNRQQRTEAARAEARKAVDAARNN